MSDGHYRSIKPLAQAYLFTDARPSINTHHPESQRFRELLTLLCDLQSQLSGWSHNYSCVKGRKNRIIGLLSLGKKNLTIWSSSDLQLGSEPGL